MGSVISSSRQLKDKVRNISDGNSNKATTLIRNFMMERFLERVSISSYRDNFILKGGMLVASIVGVDMRATMDIDTTVKALPLNEADVQRIIEEICNIPLEDNVSFQIKSTRTIMEEFDYPGIRVMLEATLDRMRQPIKIDISTDDVITLKAIEYDYKLMFEDRTISVLTYNKETLLAEKMQTIINRGIANTRLRDFYDVYSIMNFYGEQIEKCDGFYLFANLEALDFYRKLGFKEETEYRYSLKKEFCRQEVAGEVFTKVGEADEAMKQKYLNAVRHSAANAALEQVNKFGLQLFYTADLENVYYAEDLDCFIVMEMEADTLLLQSIICKEKVALREVLLRIDQPFEKCILGFAPWQEDAGLCDAQSYDGEDDYRLFYLGQKVESIEQEKLYFPELSHA